MTTSICPTVSEAGLPTIAYDHLNDPDAAHRAIAQARRQGPVAMGPHGPEFLSYELVRTMSRDPRYGPAVNAVMAAQGVTSGPLWDRATQNAACPTRAVPNPCSGSRSSVSPAQSRCPSNSSPDT
jgi:hypothetical protein